MWIQVITAIADESTCLYATNWDYLDIQRVT